VNGKFNLGRCQIPELLNLAQETIRTGEGFEREFALAAQEDLALFVKAHPLKRNGGNYLFMTATDLTKLRKLESFRSDFVANVSHEIKTPLTGIVGAVEALEDDPEPQFRRRLLEMLKLQSKRLNNLVQDILSLAALEKEQRNPQRHFDLIRLDDVAANAVNLCQLHAENAGINLVAAELTPVEIKGDSALLEQALVNLIENALKYSCGTQVTVNLNKLDNHALLSVKDNGIGILPAHQGRIFERFYRVDKSRSRELGGTGLGLAIVKHITQLHNGRAEVESTPGVGSIFKIILPLQ
ncbi:MAG: ATP-binding protein, partial [Victivallaceae bacterium]